MRRLTVLLGLATLLTTVACAPKETGTLQAATQALGAAELKSIEYSGTGKWFQFGQAPNPLFPGRRSMSAATRPASTTTTPAARVQMVRSQVVEPERVRPAPVPQRPDQVVSGTYAWNMAAPPGAAPDTAPAPQPQPEAVEERTMEIWTTPHGFLKAAAANNATSQPADGGSDGLLHRGRETEDTSAGSTRRTSSRASRPRSTTPSSATHPSRSPTPTTATSTA